MSEAIPQSEPGGRLIGALVSAPVATRLVFFVSGFLIAAWAPLIPFIKNRFQLSDAQLGLLLLCIGIGSIGAMPMTGGLAVRFGCRRVIAVVGAIACIMLPAAAAITRLEVLVPALFVFGAVLGMLDVAMNIHAVMVERALDRSMMSGFHGLWSVGGVAGAGALSLLVSIGASAMLASLVVAVLSLILLAAGARSLYSRGSEQGGPAFALPHGRVVVLGCCCFVLFLAEGSVLEWSAVFLNKERGMQIAHAGIGFIGFSVAMTTGRLTGDRIVRALGPKRIVLWGGLLAAAGFGFVVIAPSAWASVAGFVLIGVGASNVVPVMFSAAGRQESMPAHLALPAMTTLGYLGGLSGPPLIGLIAQWLGLPAALGLIGAMMFVIAVASMRMKL